MLLFIVSVLITFPYIVHKSLFLSTLFRTLVFFFSCWFSHFDNSHSDRYEWSGILLWFWFVFPWWLVMLNILSRACWPSHIFLSKMSIQVPTFYLDFLLFWYWVISGLYYFGYWPLIRYIICTYLFPFSKFSVCW